MTLCSQGPGPRSGALPLVDSMSGHAERHRPRTYDDMKMPISSRSVAGRATFIALAAISLLVAHDLVYLVQLGPAADLTRVLRAAGHEYWGLASGSVLIGAAAAGLLVMRRLLQLRRTAAALGVSGTRTPRTRFGARTGALWIRLFAIVTAGFALQENVEHLVQHGHVLGAGALVGPEYPLALPVIGAITIGAALLGAAIIGVEHGLVACITLALVRRTPRPPRATQRPPIRVTAARISMLARAGASRAPPVRLLSV